MKKIKIKIEADEKYGNFKKKGKKKNMIKCAYDKLKKMSK